MINKIILLMKKDLILIDLYKWFSLLTLIVIPIFLNATTAGKTTHLYILFMSLDFCAFLVFGQMYTMESKYKGKTYLMICPFTRFQMVLARYVLLLAMCIIGSGLYMLLVLINPAGLCNDSGAITASDVITAISGIFILYDVLFPILNIKPYEKIRPLHIIISVFVPVWGVVLVVYLLRYLGHPVDKIGELNVPLIGLVIMIALDIVITYISIRINIKRMNKAEF